MRLFSREELRSLVEGSGSDRVSIFLPTEKAGKESLQNAIRFKNLVRRAEELVIEGKRLRPPEVKEMFRPAYELIDDSLFWQHQRDGLAVYLSTGMFRYYRVPIRFDELAIVEDRFYAKPLMRLLTGDGRFYVLSVSRKQVRLYESTRHDISEVDLGDLPVSFIEVVGGETDEAHLQFHTGAPGGGGGRPAMFHGQGGGNEDVKPELRKFFQVVGKGLRELLRDREAPIVLAGVEYLLPIFREASSLPGIVEDEIGVNTAELTPDELRSRGWAIVEPRFSREHLVAASRFQRLSGTGKASADLDVIVPASIDGRVEVLFLRKGARAWGRYDHDRRRVERDGEQRDGNQDLLDFGAVQTMLQRGEVYVVDGDLMPVDGGDIAAVFRY